MKQQTESVRRECERLGRPAMVRPNPAKVEHEGAREEEVGDRRGPGCGYNNERICMADEGGVNCC